MTPAAARRAMGVMLRRLGWKFWAFALPSVIVIACAGTFQSREPAADPRSSESLGIAGDSPAGLSFIPAPLSRVELQGTATIGSWKSRSDKIHGRVLLDTDPKALDALFDRIQSVESNDGPLLPVPSTQSAARFPIAEISVPVMSLYSDSDGMDRDMQKALNVKQHPSIEYVFQQVQHIEARRDPRTHQAELILRVLGKLNMAGVNQPITMDVIVKRDSRLHYLAHAQTQLQMTHFGVTPPDALLGLIKAGDDVLVIFDLDLVVEDRSPGH